MLDINSKQARLIQKWCRFTKSKWYEGMSWKDQWVVVSVGWLHKPLFYWKESDSYIFHIWWTKKWFCISKKDWGIEYVR